MGKLVNEILSYSRDQGFERRYAYVASGNGVGQIEYEGWAQPNTATSAAGWRIVRHTYDSSHRLTASEWAGGDDAFNQRWDDRQSLAY